MVSLSALWHSTAALHRRFDNFPPDVNAQMEYVESELTELQYELSVGNPPASIAEEIVDTIVCLLSAAQGANVGLGDIENAMQRVIDKNNKKTDETHVLINQQIIRRDKLGTL